MRRVLAASVVLVMAVAGVAWAGDIAWLAVSSLDGKRNWYVPEGWKAAKGVDEEVGDILIYEGPEGAGGEYMVQGLSKERGGSCPTLVEKAALGKKGTASKGVYCAQAKDGDTTIGACAREDKKGEIILLVLKTDGKTFVKLGGLAKLRELTKKTYGIAHTTT